MSNILSQNTLGTIYFSCFHSILSYGIIFWGNSAYSVDIFKIQKRKIRVIMNARNSDSCHQLFKNLKTLPLKSLYIFSLLWFVAKSRDLYESNSEIHNINTTANLTFQKGPFYFGINVFNHLPFIHSFISHSIDLIQMWN